MQKSVYSLLYLNSHGCSVGAPGRGPDARGPEGNEPAQQTDHVADQQAGAVAPFTRPVVCPQVGVLGAGPGQVGGVVNASCDLETNGYSANLTSFNKVFFRQAMLRKFHKKFSQYCLFCASFVLFCMASKGNIYRPAIFTADGGHHSCRPSALVCSGPRQQII